MKILVMGSGGVGGYFGGRLAQAGIDATIAPDIRRTLWLKFAMLASFSGMTTLTGHTVGPLRETAGTRALLEAAVREVIAVGRAAGVKKRRGGFCRAHAGHGEA
jgi:ketopantoate reductase